LTNQTWKSKGFIKSETYVHEVKQPRCINSPSDESKVILGYIIYVMDKALYSINDHGWFTKGTAPRDWPDMLEAKHGDEPVMETDFSSFEAHHSEDFCRIAKFWMMHIIRPLCSSSERKLIARMVEGTNECLFSTLKCRVAQRLMSGVLWTSSMNGMLNLLLMSYIIGKSDPILRQLPTKDLASRAKSYFRGSVEGDDGLCTAKHVDVSIIKKLGLDLKFERHPHYSQAGFCGIITVLDTHRSIVTDPIKFLSNFFLLDKKFLDSIRKHGSLIKAKCISAKYNYGNTPVIGPFVDAVLKMVRHKDITNVLSELDERHRDFVLAGLKDRSWLKPAQPTQASRDLMAVKFKVSVQTQLEWEDALSRADLRQTSPFVLDSGKWLDLQRIQHVRDHVFVYDGSHPLVLPRQQWLAPIVTQIYKYGLEPTERNELADKADREYEPGGILF